MSDSKDYSEDSKNFYLNEQNKKKKKKLEEEYGMIGMSDRGDAPPEVMNNFLSSVEEFEEAWKNVEDKKVKEILNYPEFKKAEEIQSALLKAEIEKILGIYAKYNFYVDIIEKNDVSDIDFYRFLTEELPEHETSFVNVPGMNTNFIYEEFHPNDKLEAKNSVEYFLSGLKNKYELDIDIWLSDEPILINGKTASKSELINELNNLIPDNVSEKEITFNNIDIEKNEVNAYFKLWYKENELSDKVMELILQFTFIVEKSEHGMYNIKSIRYNIIKK